MDQKKTGLFLKELRKEKGLTQSQLAEKFGVSDRTVSRWETGANMPDLSILVELSDYYDVDIKEIIRGERKTAVSAEPEITVDAEKIDIIEKEQRQMDKNEKETLLTVADYAKSKEKRKVKKVKIIFIVILAVVVTIATILLVRLGAGALLAYGIYRSAENGENYELTLDTASYNDVIGEEKWGMSEDIFPAKLDGLNVVDFKHIYYNPWDANYLAYLVVDYDSKEAYDAEISRLKRICISDYKGYYGVTGFTDYTLVAMNADSYNGFVYAITDNESRIIYVELIFCNYFTDIDYEKEIPSEYLPDGFNAKPDNDYEKKCREELNSSASLF